jgi:alpha-1,3-glucosyltransferase
MFWTVFIIASCVKTLFIPSYKSTDFEVHRNWLAVTSSLPHTRWYTEATSPWTLDYPPLFAWFEYLLSSAGRLADPAMLKVDNLDYSSRQTVLFQRMSVIVTDLVFALGTQSLVKSLPNISSRLGTKWSGRFPRASVLTWLLLSNAGLLMVDHIHFQYNGFLTGVLLLGLAAVCQEKFILSAIWFSLLLNLKHIYLYMAPAFGIYMLRSYCLQSDKEGRIIISSFSITRFLSLATSVLTITGMSLGPFLQSGQLPNLLSRLFPLQRGLCHAYWAPNFWALYNSADKALTIVFSKLDWMKATPTASMTGGLVQDISHSVLPNIAPLATVIISGLSMAPGLVKLWLSPSPVNFLRCLVICAWSSFMFGWHVHEKAILLVTIPLTLLGCVNKNEARIFFLVTVIGNFSLFPLLFQTRELPSKVLLHLCHCLLVSQALPTPSFPWWDKLYLFFSLPVFLLSELVYPLVGVSHLPFLPLLLYSLYSALGLAVSYLRFYWNFLVS